MKKAAKKQTGQTREKESQANQPPQFRLIKNENWRPVRNPKLRINPLPDDLPPAA